jgi:outer membrane lipoprotein-sorting protein
VNLFLRLSLPALLAVPSIAAAQGDASVIVGRAAQVYRGLTSLRADFKQVIDDEAVGTFESRGVMVQSGQNKLTMRFSDPKGDAIVLDGKFVWVYTPSTTPGQVLRMPIPTGPVYGFNVLAWLLDKPAERYRSKYIKRDFVDFVQTDVVELVPLADDLPFKKATLWLDRDTALPPQGRDRGAGGRHPDAHAIEAQDQRPGDRQDLPVRRAERRAGHRADIASRRAPSISAAFGSDRPPFRATFSASSPITAYSRFASSSRACRCARTVPASPRTIGPVSASVLPRISRLRHVPSSSGRNIRPAASAGIPAASASRSARADNATV